MLFYSPGSGIGGGNPADPSVDLSTVEQLQRRIADLEAQVETMRKRHQAEIRRSLETVEQMQNRGSGAARDTLPGYPPTHGHSDGFDVLTHQRVAVLIDVQNMYYAARNLHNSKLEFSKLLSFLSRRRMLARAIAYIVERPGMEQDKFVEVLRRNGYEVRKKVLIERSDGSQKGDWDLGMSLDAVALADKVDVVILVTGDGDFVSLTHYLHSRGVRVEVASFPETTALELIRACDYYHRLNERVLLTGGQFAPPADADDKPTHSTRSRDEESGSSGDASRRPRENSRADRAPISNLEDDDFEL
ncbi:MAG: NYN domain-containing protein [Planctomycetota bacterium]